MYYTTDNKIKQFILSTSKLFNSKEDLVKAVTVSLSEHKKLSLESMFYYRVLREIDSYFFLFSAAPVKTKTKQLK